jgi:hypothetical protein
LLIRRREQTASFSFESATRKCPKRPTKSYSRIYARAKFEMYVSKKR